MWKSKLWFEIKTTKAPTNLYPISRNQTNWCLTLNNKQGLKKNHKPLCPTSSSYWVSMVSLPYNQGFWDYNSSNWNKFRIHSEKKQTCIVINWIYANVQKLWQLHDHKQSTHYRYNTSIKIALTSFKSKGLLCLIS